MDEEVIEDIAASPDEADSQPRKRKPSDLDRTAPDFVKTLQNWARYTGKAAAAGATIMFALIAILNGIACGLEAVAKSNGIDVPRGKPAEGA